MQVVWTTINWSISPKDSFLMAMRGIKNNIRDINFKNFSSNRGCGYIVCKIKICINKAQQNLKFPC